MPHLQRKSFESPDEVRAFANGRVGVVRMDEVSVARFVLQPGWRWSRDVKPIAATRSCQLRHMGYVISGALHVWMDDGTELVVRAGDAYDIPPGHDAAVEGEEAWDSVEFTSGNLFALSPEDLGERVLATVVFSDIVGSTSTVERLGDRAWTQLVQEHNKRIRD